MDFWRISISFVCKVPGKNEKGQWGFKEEEEEDSKGKVLKMSDIIRAQKLTKIQTTTHFVALFDKLEKQWKRKVSPKVKLAWKELFNSNHSCQTRWRLGMQSVLVYKEGRLGGNFPYEASF